MRKIYLYETLIFIHEVVRTWTASTYCLNTCNNAISLLVVYHVNALCHGLWSIKSYSPILQNAKTRNRHITPRQWIIADRTAQHSSGKKVGPTWHNVGSPGSGFSLTSVFYKEYGRLLAQHYLLDHKTFIFDYKWEIHARENTLAESGWEVHV